MPETKVLNPHDAEKVEKILCEVRRTCGPAPNSRLPAPIPRVGIRSRLQITTSADGRRGRFRSGVWERKVVRGVVDESGKFGDLESSKTAQEQSEQRGED